MKTKFKLAALAKLALLSTIKFQLSTCLAQGTAFTYQGQLDSSGTPANGSFDLTFALFSTSIGGSPSRAIDQFRHRRVQWFIRSHAGFRSRSFHWNKFLDGDRGEHQRRRQFHDPGSTAAVAADALCDLRQHLQQSLRHAFRRTTERAGEQ